MQANVAPKSGSYDQNFGGEMRAGPLFKDQTLGSRRLMCARRIAFLCISTLVCTFNGFWVHTLRARFGADQ